MEIIWIIGVGKFGAAAAKRLSQQHKNWQFVLVDPVKENLLKAKGVNMAIEQTDGIGFLSPLFGGEHIAIAATLVANITEFR